MKILSAEEEVDTRIRKLGKQITNRRMFIG